MPTNVEMIIRERNALRDKMWAWTSDWQDIADLMMPGKSDILSIKEPGNSRTRELFDSTALWASDTFVAHLGAWITNFQMQFFGLRMRALRDNQEASQWLDEVARVQYEEMVTDDAPVPTAVHEAYRQYANMGTACLFIDERPMDERLQLGFRGFQAHNIPVGQYGIEENSGGRVDTIIRDVELTPHQAEQIWGKDNLHFRMREMLEDENATQRRWQPHKFIHKVAPRRQRDRARSDNLNMPWQSVWVDETNKHEVDEGGFPWFPFMVFRWEKLVQHNPFGFGRGHLVLPEAKTLQLIDRDALRALPLSIMPPGWLIGTSRETVGRVSLLPGAMNPLAAGGSFQPYESGSRMDIAQLQIEERRNRILRAFFIDQLMFLPPAEQRTQRTFGELQLRQRQMARIMGPALMRLLVEFYNPFIDVTFALGLRGGIFPDPPDAIIDAAIRNQGKIDVDPRGILVRVQKDEETEAIAEGVEFLINIAANTGDPTVLRNVDMDESMSRFLKSRGFPEALVTDRRVMAEIRAEAERAAQAAQANQEAMNIAQAARDAAPMAKVLTETAGATA